MEKGSDQEQRKQASGPFGEGGDCDTTPRTTKTGDTTATAPMASKTKAQKKQKGSTPSASPFTKTEHCTKHDWESSLAPQKPQGETKAPKATTRTTKPKLVGWENPVVTALPRNFPLEPSHVEVPLEGSSLLDVVSRLSVSFQQSFRVMSIQAKYMDKPASAALLTPENVELYLALWESSLDAKVLIVEVQTTRQGDSVIASQYARHVLSVASGSFDASAFPADEDVGRYLQAAHAMFKNEPLDRDANEKSAASIQMVYDHLLHGDTKRLGAEGLCTLVNARDTVLTAAIHASRAVLLGSNQSEAEQGLHEFVLDILLKRSVGQDGRYPSGHKSYFAGDDQSQEIMSFLYLALEALVHALEIAITFDLNVPANPTMLEAPSSSAAVAVFLANSKQETNKDVIDELLQIVQRAHWRPHHAWLATKCLRYLCLASSEAKEAARKHIGVMADAYDEGRESHAKLEAECRRIRNVLGN